MLDDRDRRRRWDRDRSGSGLQTSCNEDRFGLEPLRPTPRHGEPTIARLGSGTRQSGVPIPFVVLLWRLHWEAWHYYDCWRAAHRCRRRDLRDRPRGRGKARQSNSEGGACPSSIRGSGANSVQVEIACRPVRLRKRLGGASFLSGVIGGIDVRDTPWSGSIELHYDLLFGPGKMVCLWLHDHHASRR